MKGYSKKELQEFKELILKKREKAIGEFNNLTQQLNDNSTRDTDPMWLNANYASEAISLEELNRDAERLGKYILALNAALGRIETGNYGICVKTGELIPKGRLMAVPHATLSVDAKLGQMK
jgi:DnaK suppressor protein